MPVEDEIHQCEILELQGRYLEYVCAGKHNARWRLIHDMDGDIEEYDERDEVFMQRVLFCPGCGKDLRGDISTHSIGQPYENEVLKKVGCGKKDP